MIRKGYLALLSAITLTNCTDQFSAVQQMNKFDEIPVGITEELHLIYSDSARIEAELIARSILILPIKSFRTPNSRRAWMQLYMAIEVKSHSFDRIMASIIQKQKSLI